MNGAVSYASSLKNPTTNAPSGVMYLVFTIGWSSMGELKMYGSLPPGCSSLVSMPSVTKTSPAAVIPFTSVSLPSLPMYLKEFFSVS